MDEAEWHGERRLAPLLRGLLIQHWQGYFLRWIQRRSSVHSNRKLRLFACGCVRQIADQLSPAEHALLDCCERCAEGQATSEEIETAVKDVAEGTLGQYLASLTRSVLPWVPFQIDIFGWSAYRIAQSVQAKNACPDDESVLCDVLRDIFTPFGVPAFDPHWLTWRDNLIASMARTIYEENRFADMPVLADALEDAGCTDRTILAHCRADKPHVRGCWVIDGLLGKT